MFELFYQPIVLKNMLKVFWKKTMKSVFGEKLKFGQSWKYSDSVGNIRTPLEIFGQLLGVVLSEYFQHPCTKNL